MLYSFYGTLFLSRALSASLVNSMTFVTNEADIVSYIIFYDFTFWLIKSTAVDAFLSIFWFSFKFFLSIFDTVCSFLSKWLKMSSSSSILYLSSYLYLLFLRAVVLLLCGELNYFPKLAESSRLLISNFFIFLLRRFKSLLDVSEFESSIVVFVVAPADYLYCLLIYFWIYCYCSLGFMLSFGSSGK
jgi:hypothetical protein